MISRSPSHFTTEPCVSIGVWISQGVRKVISTTASASAKPFATSPRSYLSGLADAVAALVEGGRPGLERLLEVHDEGQLLVLDLDRPRGRAGLVQRLGRDRRHLLALVTAVRVEEPAQRSLRREVEGQLRAGAVGGEDRAHAGHRQRLARVHLLHARVGVRAAGEGGVEHVGQHEVAGVDGRAADALVRVDARLRGADDLGLGPGATACRSWLTSPRCGALRRRAARP